MKDTKTANVHRVCVHSLETLGHGVLKEIVVLGQFYLPQRLMLPSADLLSPALVRRHIRAEQRLTLNSRALNVL